MFSIEPAVIVNQINSTAGIFSRNGLGLVHHKVGVNQIETCNIGWYLQAIICKPKPGSVVI